MRREDVPGHLEIVDKPKRWMDYLLASNLSAEHKLCGIVIAQTCSYNRIKELSLSAISNYTISRILKMNSDQVQSLVDDLISLGYLLDTNERMGARKIFTLTFSVEPLGKIKQ